MSQISCLIFLKTYRPTYLPTYLPSYISSPICFVATPKHKKHLVKDDGSSQNLKVHTLSRPCWQFWGRGSHRPKCRLFKQRYFYRDPKPKKDFCILLKLDPLHISCVIPSLPHLTPVIMINKILENISCQIVPIKSPFHLKLSKSSQSVIKLFLVNLD